MRTWAVAAVVVALVVGSGLIVWNKVLGGCTSTQDYVVAADPSIASTVADVVAQSSKKDLHCARLDVRAESTGAVTGQLSRHQDVPDLWVPDSSQTLARTSRGAGVVSELAAQSIATTPVVLAARRGEIPYFTSWMSVLQTRGIGIGDPLTDPTAAAPIVGALSEIEHGHGTRDDLASALVPVAQAQSAAPRQPSMDARLDDVARNGGLAIATEQQITEYSAGTNPPGVVSFVPQTGTVVLDYPVAVTAPEGDGHDDAQAAGRALAKVMSSDDGKRALAKKGFRTADFSPLGVDDALGTVPVLAVSDEGQFDAVLKSYAVLALPLRTLAVIDVSDSMRTPTGASSRIDLTVQAGQTGLRLFADNAQVGLWAFATDLGGPGQDWRELQPIRRMSDRVGDSTQRDRLLADDARLPSLVGGGTGLFDTTLAAWREVKKNYDSNSVNSVLLLTAGTDDDPSSISLAQLVATLKREQDPAKPVIIVTLGIGQSADANVLQQISAATGGLNYIARNASDIPNVYVNALRSRPGGR